MCCAATSWAFTRHKGIRNELADLCSDLNLHVDVEKGPGGTLLRPADVFVQGLVDEPLAVDVGVVHSLPSSIKIAEVQLGKSAKKMKQQNVLERQAQCQRNGWRFLPFLVKTIGVFGGKAQFIMQKIYPCGSTRTAA